MKTETLTDGAFSALGNRLGEPVIVDLMVKALETPGLLSLAPGITCNEVLPGKLVSEVVRRLCVESADLEALQYGTAQGRIGLREAISKMLEAYPHENKGAFSPDHMLISNGSQQALYLAVQVLCNPGDVILVEQPTYFVFLELLKGLGIEAVSIPAHDSGRIDIEGLRALIDDYSSRGELDKIKGLYLVSYYSNPSSRSVLAEDKTALGEFLIDANLSQVTIMEDAAYRDVYFESPYPAPTIQSIPALQSFSKLYFGSFSKSFASGLKIGFVHASDRTLLDKMMYVKGHHDFGSANFSQAILEAAIVSGEYAQHVDGQRAVYQKKAACLSETLEKAGLRGIGWSWDEPEGGLFIWAQAPGHLDLSLTEAFCKACIEGGVCYVPGDLCFAAGERRNFARLSYGTLGIDDLKTAAERFAAVAKSHT